MPIKKKLDKNGQKPRQNAHSQKLDKNARQHAPNGKKQIDLKKLSWKNVCSLWQGSPVPHDTLVITWTGLAENYMVWGQSNWINETPPYIYNIYIWRRLINIPVGGVDSAAHHVIIAILGI